MNKKERAVIVTTAHRGVFFGYAKDTSGPITAAVGLVQEIDGPLALCGSGALHATLTPENWKGERMWLVALHGEVIEDDNKVGALKREFLAEVPLI